MKPFYKTVLAVYLFTLLWVVLFKLSGDVFAVLANYQTRSLNLVPFTGFSPGNAPDVLYNFIVFIPFGLLLSVNFKQASFRRKLAAIVFVSAAVEVAQYVFAIGTSDITDVITNTAGGLLGLGMYALANRYISTTILNRFIAIISLVLLAAFLLLRLLVFHIRYQ
ncbi:MAG TPA: VanZ family protein [Candidatus Saccharimonadales bacterium]|nr:VanZ family protein [Candidatus Saccharimonadales bacterium]